MLSTQEQLATKSVHLQESSTKLWTFKQLNKAEMCKIVIQQSLE